MYKCLVSVVVPTFKRSSAMLERCINSVLKQTYKNTEVIIVDDNAAPENSMFRKENVKLIKTNFNDSKRIKLVLNKENLGGAISRNAGIKAAKGKFVTFLDDDDVFLERKIENQVTYMLNNNLNCSFTDLYIYNDEDKLVDKRIHTDIKENNKDYLLKYHLTKMITGTETFMVEKKILDAIGGFDNVLTGHEFFLMYKLLNYSNLRMGYYSSNDIKAYRTKLPSISNGSNKIKGEMFVYQFKRTHFDVLSFKERKYIIYRHYCVMAIAHRRNKHFFRFLWYLILAFVISPILSIKDFSLFVKIKKK